MGIVKANALSNHIFGVYALARIAAPENKSLKRQTSWIIQNHGIVVPRADAEL